MGTGFLSHSHIGSESFAQQTAPRAFPRTHVLLWFSTSKLRQGPSSVECGFGNQPALSIWLVIAPKARSRLGSN